MALKNEDRKRPPGLIIKLNQIEREAREKKTTSDAEKATQEAEAARVPA